MDYARVRILQALQADERVHATVGSDFTRLPEVDPPTANCWA